MFNDRNPVERWLQRQRLVTALAMAPDKGRNDVRYVLDFGRL
ncbi:hypothetical protein [uncultured Massilia sp.]|nr:hypothetical protein [uncultured Massilia sp.]